MSAFDAERYLRLVGERGLQNDDDNRGGMDVSPVAEAAAALLVAGLVDGTLARTVVAEYDVAAALRNGDHRHFRPSLRPAPPSPQAAEPIAPRRLAILDRTIERPWGTLTVRYALLSEHGTHLAVRARLDDSQMVRSGHGLPALAVADAQGETSASMGSGGSGGGSWHASYHTARPLDVDATWLEIEGERIELDHPGPRVSVRVEQLADGARVWRYLWHLVATSNHFTNRDVNPAIEALVAAGAIAPEDPQIAQIRSIAERGPYGHGSSSMAGALPALWRSVMRQSWRAPDGGPSRTIPVGAMVADLDGMSVAVNAVELGSRRGFAAVCETAGEGERYGPWEGGLPGPGLAWWAADDRGNHFLGHVGSWGGHPGHGSGTIEFSGALDPKATRIDLMPTTVDTRAVITVELPDE